MKPEPWLKQMRFRDEDQSRQKAERDSAQFRAAHPNLYEEETSIGDSFLLNGEELISPATRRKRKKARRSAFFLWLKRWAWLIVVILILIYNWVRLPIPVHRTMQGYVMGTGETVDVEIQGVVWHAAALSDYFFGIIRQDAESIKVKANLPKMYETDGNRYPSLVIYTSDSMTENMQNFWDDAHHYPRVRGLFREIALYYRGQKIAIPASDEAEAKAVLERLGY